LQIAERYAYTYPYTTIFDFEKMNFKNYWDIFTDKFSSLIIHPQYFIKRYTNNSVKLALQYAKGTLLDVGCGRMPYKKEFLPCIDKYIGLDHPEVAKYYKGEEKPDIFADSTQIPLPSSSCDTVTCFQVLEHIPEPIKALKEMHRVLKKNGIIIISTIQYYPLHDEPYDFYRYTKYGLSHLLHQANFVELKHKEEGNIFTLLFQSINIYLMFILENTSKRDGQKLITILLAPFFLSVTTLLNLLTFVFLPFDNKSKFRIIHTLVAEKN